MDPIFSIPEQRTLLKIARDSIQKGFKAGHPLPINRADFSNNFLEKRAVFTTLEKEGNLRGCIGSLIPVRSLVEEVARSAFLAAFKDPRFPPLSEAEFSEIEISLSILSPLEPISCQSEQELIDQLRPGVDGLMIQEGSQSGTFLPTVWEELSDRGEFLRHLKRKAGLPENYWSPSLHFFRYTTSCFSEKESLKDRS